MYAYVARGGDFAGLGSGSGPEGPGPGDQDVAGDQGVCNRVGPDWVGDPPATVIGQREEAPCQRPGEPAPVEHAEQGRGGEEREPGEPARGYGLEIGGDQPASQVAPEGQFFGERHGDDRTG